MEEKIQKYIKIMHDCTELMKQEDKRRESERIYVLAFITVIRLLATHGKSDQITVTETVNDLENEQDEKTGICISYGQDRYTYNRDFLTNYISNELTSVLDMYKEPEVIPDSEPEPEPEYPADEEIQTEPEEPEEPEKEYIPAGKVQEVETVEVKSSVDYSSVISEKVTAEKQEPEPSAVEPVQEPETPIQSDSSYFCSKYEKDPYGKKKQDAFLFDQYMIDAGELKIKVNVYPLRYAETEPVSTALFVTLKGNNGVFRGYISNEEGIKNIRAVFADMEFLISGRWINGVFHSIVQLLKQADIKINKTEHRPEHPTASTHLIMKKKDHILHVFPTEWKNNASIGLAGSVIWSETEKTVFLPNPQYYTPFSKNTQDYLMTYWQGNGVDSVFEVSDVE